MEDVAVDSGCVMDDDAIVRHLIYPFNTRLWGESEEKL